MTRITDLATGGQVRPAAVYTGQHRTGNTGFTMHAVLHILIPTREPMLRTPIIAIVLVRMRLTATEDKTHKRRLSVCLSVCIGAMINMK